MNTGEERMKQIQITWDGSLISVVVDGSCTLTIENQLKGTIKAKDIFDSFCYQYGDKYALLPLNLDQKDSAYSFIYPFYQLYEELCKEINEIEIDDDNTKEIKLDSATL